MNSKISCALIAAIASAALPVLAAKAPPPAAPPPAPTVKTVVTATQMTICYSSGMALLACADAWQQMTDAGNQVDSPKAAWESSGYTNFVAGIRFLNQDSSWCDPAGAETTYEDAFKAVAKYLHDNSEQVSSSPAAVLVSTALHAAYPCVKKGAH